MYSFNGNELTLCQSCVLLLVILTLLTSFQKQHWNQVCQDKTLTSFKQPMKLLLTGDPGRSAVLGLPPM